MAAVDRLLGWAALACAWLAAALVTAMVVHTITEIVLRNLFDTSTFVLPEFVGYFMAGSVFLGLPIAFRDGAHIRVHILLAAAPAPLRRVLELAATVAALVVVLYLIRYYWLDITRNLARGATSDSLVPVPLWLPPSLVLVGLGVFAAQLLRYAGALLAGGPLIASAGDAEPS